jgi:hypothetical protein
MTKKCRSTGLHAKARSALHFPFHGIRRVLRLFACPLDVVAQTVNRVTSHIRA